MTAVINDHLVLICGPSAAGKSASLHTLANPEGVLYACCEAGKRLPFRSKFKEINVTDPVRHIPELFQYAEQTEKVHTVVIDTLTFLMDMYESLYVLPAKDKMAGWSNYAEFFRNMMQQRVAPSKKNMIFLAHTLTNYDQNTLNMTTSVPIKGALKNIGIESMFSCVVAAKKMSLESLAPYANPLLKITPMDEMLGYKHVFQTQITKDTIGERIRGTMGMWTLEETFIDNDAQLLLNRLHEFHDA